MRCGELRCQRDSYAREMSTVVVSCEPKPIAAPTAGAAKGKKKSQKLPPRKPLPPEDRRPGGIGRGKYRAPRPCIFPLPPFFPPRGTWKKGHYDDETNEEHEEALSSLPEVVELESEENTRLASGGGRGRQGQSTAFGRMQRKKQIQMMQRAHNGGKPYVHSAAYYEVLRANGITEF